MYVGMHACMYVCSPNAENAVTSCNGTQKAYTRRAEGRKEKEQREAERAASHRATLREEPRSDTNVSDSRAQ